MMKENLNKINIDIEVTLHYTKEKLLDDYKWVVHFFIGIANVWMIHALSDRFSIFFILFTVVANDSFSFLSVCFFCRLCFCLCLCLDDRKSQLLALLLCIGSADIALGNQQAEQRFLDVLRDLYKDGVLNIEELSF